MVRKVAVRVASVPSGHPYVRHLSAPDGRDGVVRLEDPQVPGAPAGQWWPHPMLEAAWVHEHARDFDLFHVHFGFENRSARQLRALVAALRQAERPLVLTVHDIRNPHHADPGAQAAALEVLVPAADGLITLTDGAAREVARRWGREPVVIPHPHLVGAERMAQPRPHHDGFVVGLHAKSERANNDSVAVARGLARALTGLPGARLRVDAHDDASGVAVAAALDGLDVRVHGRFSDDELWDYLSDLDVSVLPYRFGTHSGWLEACRDLGTTVLAPSCGYYADQGPVLVFRHDDSGLDQASLTDAVRRAWARRADFGADPAARIRQRLDVSAAHRQVYRRALAAPAAAGS
jgi:glycosyltransferase involved in cell wall biosynthesis